MNATLHRLPRAYRARGGAPASALLSGVYVDAATGSDGAAGSEDAPVRTLARALAVLAASADLIAAAGATPTVFAASTAGAPFRERVVVDPASLGGLTALRLAAWGYDADAAERAYLQHAAAHTSGWTAMGGGVYSKATGTPHTRTVAVMTITNARAVEALLVRNALAPTAPAEGEFGYSGGLLYVRLPGDADPNAHTVEVDAATTPAEEACLTASGVALRLDGFVVKIGRLFAVWIERGGYLTGAGCTFALASSSVVSTGGEAGSGFDLTGGEVYGGLANDGVNMNAPAGTVSYCRGVYVHDNGDEGLSQHNGDTLYVLGGEVAHNGSAGVFGVDGSAYHAWDAELHHNGESGGPRAGGIGWDTARGSVLRCSIHDNAGRGIAVDPAACVGVTVGAGADANVSASNGLPDLLCP
jgi:hypothetical protein